MSFILDALKKSESDRQRQSGPSLFEVKVAPPRRRLPIWAVAIAALLGINVIVVSWMLLRHPSEQAPAAAVRSPGAAAATAPATATAGATAPAPLAVPPPAPATASSDKTTPATALATAAASASTPAASAGSSQPASAAPLASHADASQPDQSAAERSEVITPSDYAPAVEPNGTQGSAASAGTTDDLPLYQQIVASAGLPSLHLDLHVFAKRPQDRFVMINMHRLQEGDSLPSGVQVEAIRPDGVVLSYHGTRFLLPRN